MAIEINLTGKNGPVINKQVLQPVQQYVGVYSAGQRFYKNGDEAILNSPENAFRMWYDPIIQQPLSERIMRVVGQEWFIEPDDKRDPKQQKRAGQLKNYIQAIPDLTKYLYALQTAVWFGKSGVQNVFEFRYDHDGQKYLAVSEWDHVWGDSLYRRWDVGHQNQWGILISAPNTPGTIKLNPEQISTTDVGLAYLISEKERENFVIHTHLHLQQDFFHYLKAGLAKGTGLRDLVYWAWYSRSEFQGILMEFCERLGTGITVWRYDASNPDNKEAIQSVAQSLAANGQVFMPYQEGEKSLGAAIERIEPDSAGVENLKGVVQYYDHQIKLLINGQELTSESKPTGLGSAISETHENTAFQITRLDSANLEETLTRDLVKVIHKYSFPNDKFDLKWKFAKRLPYPAETLQGIKTYFEMGGQVNQQEVADLLGITVPDADLDEILQKSKAPQQTKKEQVKDLLEENPETSTETIMKACKVSRQYANRIKKELSK
jgi:phage gp29-like protein